MFFWYYMNIPKFWRVGCLGRISQLEDLLIKVSREAEARFLFLYRDIKGANIPYMEEEKSRVGLRLSNINSLAYDYENQFVFWKAPTPDYYSGYDFLKRTLTLIDAEISKRKYPKRA